MITKSTLLGRLHAHKSFIQLNNSNISISGGKTTFYLPIKSFISTKNPSDKLFLKSKTMEKIKFI